MDYSSGTACDAASGLVSGGSLENVELMFNSEGPGDDVDFRVGFAASPYNDIKVIDEIERTFAEIDMRAHYAALELDHYSSV